ncbi:Oligopeptide ABC transporter, periplasmic oligopeptide-binding protein OppA [Lachnospiraceae bacterium TWA4]|nr:Oligopeptide ABC transporter, periplasmic oligopeptide-binding protein OppA [Lachnospiraceae bacterium TWA4]
MKKLLIPVVSSALAISLLATGCSNSSGASNTTTKAAEESGSAKATDAKDVSAVQKGGTLRVGVSQSCDTLDPTNGYDGWYTVRFGVGETLFKFNEDMTTTGWLVEDDYELSDDQLTWTFTIKDDVKFSNGTKVTAELAKASIERVFELNVQANSYFKYKEIKADGQKLTVTTEELTPNLRGLLSDPMFSIIDTTVDLTDAKTKGVIGTGPYVFTDFNDVDRIVKVTKNENYWAGEVNLDAIEYTYFSDLSAMQMAVKSDEMDAAYGVSMTDLPDFESDKDNFKAIVSASGRTDFAFMNQTKGALADKDLRQAIQMCLDKKSICENLLNNAFVPGITPLSSVLPYGYDELEDNAAFDVEGAKKLLEDAGYKDSNNNGFRENKDGEEFKITIKYSTTRPEFQILGEAWQNAAKEIGIEIELAAIEQSTLFSTLTSGEYEVCMISISTTSTGDPEGFFSSYFTTNKDNSNYNATGYSSEAFDGLINQLKTEFDTNKRIDLIKQAEQVLMDDAVCGYLCYPMMNFATKSNVVGVTSSTSDYYWVSKDTGFTN